MQNNIKLKSKSRKEYKQGLLFSLAILIVGIILELITGGAGTGMPSWPVNVQLGLSFIIILVFVHIYYRDLNFVKWITRVPAAVSSIVLFSLLVLIMGLSPQDDPEAHKFLHYTGFSHVRNSYPFILSGLFLLTSLGLVILRRSSPLNLKNIGFLLNHLGLWLIVFAGSLGAGDLQRVTIRIHENDTVWYGMNSMHQIRELPFTLKLIDFSIDEYNPKLAYIRKEDMSFPENIKNNLMQIENKMQVRIEDWDITVSDFYMSSLRDSSGFYPSFDSLSFPSAFLEAINVKNGIKKKGWISCGNFKVNPEFFDLDDIYSLAMTMPEPKTFSSLLEIVDRDGNNTTQTLLVNKPVKVSGWNLYQLSYDERMGKWSRLSVIEAIKDPWLGVIYAGIFMVLAGAVYMFWLGKN